MPKSTPRRLLRCKPSLASSRISFKISGLSSLRPKRIVGRSMESFSVWSNNYWRNSTISSSRACRLPLPLLHQLILGWLPNSVDRLTPKTASWIACVRISNASVVSRPLLLEGAPPRPTWTMRGEKSRASSSSWRLRSLHKLQQLAAHPKRISMQRTKRLLTFNSSFRPLNPRPQLRRPLRHRLGMVKRIKRYIACKTRCRNCKPGSSSWRMSWQLTT
mmetsp:Transcript_6962/g.10952  ORF Transcript_6962/g.10952 Transcript_6962/m.10952 type:complete len:218 (+) Transcript_6962:192-845(+)